MINALWRHRYGKLDDLNGIILSKSCYLFIYLCFRLCLKKVWTCKNMNCHHIASFVLTQLWCHLRHQWMTLDSRPTRCYAQMFCLAHAVCYDGEMSNMVFSFFREMGMSHFRSLENRRWNYAIWTDMDMNSWVPPSSFLFSCTAQQQKTANRNKSVT